MSGKSKEEIAFELVSKLKGVGVWGENNMSDILDMYSLCLEATSGLRSVDGKTPSALQLNDVKSAPAKKAPAPALRQAAPARPAPAPQHAPAPATPAQQPQVRQQQQMVQQAYQQQQPPVAR
jgi:hypothetical protein